MTYVLVGFGFGVLLSPIIGWAIYRYFFLRVVLRDFLLREAIDLEKRRRRADYGRDELPREGAGPSAEVGTLFPTRPGALMLDHLRKKNLASYVDTDQDSGKLKG